MKIITGKTGRPHVTSRQFRGMMEGIIGQDSYVITHGENLEPELMTNNKLKIKSGMMCHHGNISTVEIGTYDEVTIQNGTQGMKRIDLIVNRYSKEEGSEIEENNWVVIQGIPSAETPVAPAYTEGNLQEGDLVDDCPVFEAHLDGINVTEIKKLLSVTPDMSTINKDLSELQLYHDKKMLTPTDLGLNTGIWKTIVNNSYKTGNTIHLNMEIYTTAIIVANNVYNNAFTIPSQYRPLIDTAVNVTASDGEYKNPVACTSLAKANGNLFFCIPKATNNYLFIDAEWECA